MYIDFVINKIDINETEAKNLVKSILDMRCVNSITVPHYLIKSLKPILNDEGVDFSCLIDYPLGISDQKTRLCAIEQAGKNGSNCIDITMPQNLASNRKYDKIRDDVKNVVEITKEYKITPRYILEYRVFDHHCLKKICEIFDNFGIKYVYPSSGYFIDNLADNILACLFLHQNSKDLNIIGSGNIWTNKHFETLLKSKIFGFRTNSIHSLQNFIIFNANYQK
jgi:deoxyribose-phosphate aldolase